MDKRKKKFCLILEEDILDNGFMSLTGVRTFYSQDLDKNYQFYLLKN